MLTSRRFGVYDPGCPACLGPVSAWEEHLGVPITILSWYQAWGSFNGPCSPERVAEVVRRGMVPLITWEPWRFPDSPAAAAAPADQPDFALTRILEGRYDGYIQGWARDLARCPGPVWLRPLHEMNGNWYPWGGTVNGNTPELFRQVWGYLRSVFLAAGTDQVRWLWCPYAASVPAGPENALEKYFPGPEQVDLLGLDGYNWGATQPWSRWESFTEMFGEAYATLVRLAPDKPIIIAELGCAEAGGDKAAWIRDAFRQINSHFEKIRAMVWFQIDKECDWRLDSSPGALAAFREQRRFFQNVKRAPGEAPS